MNQKGDGERILEGLAEARKFLGQVSLLVQTVEDELASKGWAAYGYGNKAATLTGHLRRPDEWMPRAVFRFFVRDEEDEGKRDLLLFIGVLLDPKERYPGFKEPLLTCGVYVFMAGTREEPGYKGYEWDEHWVEGPLQGDYAPDGKFYHEDDTSDLESYGLQYTVLMAVPLISITSEDGLKQTVVNPLLEEADKVAQKLNC